MLYRLTEHVGFSSNHDGDGVVVKDRWHVFRWKFVGRVGNEEARFAHGAIANDNAFDRLHSQLVFGCYRGMELNFYEEKKNCFFTCLAVELL